LGLLGVRPGLAWCKETPWEAGQGDIRISQQTAVSATQQQAQQQQQCCSVVKAISDLLLMAQAVVWVAGQALPSLFLSGCKRVYP
jgi:hypothetical protein